MSTLREERAARVAAGKVRRAQRETELAARIKELPDKRYGVILADPYWGWSADAIASLDIASLAAKHCVLWLWVPPPALRDAVQVMQGWGFRYKSMLCWKMPETEIAEVGNWYCKRHELLLLGTRGKPVAPAPGTQSASVIEADARPGEKPQVIYDLIERYFPNTPKVELFRRGAARPGWHAWGSEAA